MFNTCKKQTQYNRSFIYYFLDEETFGPPPPSETQENQEGQKTPEDQQHEAFIKEARTAAAKRPESQEMQQKLAAIEQAEQEGNKEIAESLAKDLMKEHARAAYFSAIDAAYKEMDEATKSFPYIITNQRKAEIMQSHIQNLLNVELNNPDLKALLNKAEMPDRAYPGTDAIRFNFDDPQNPKVEKTKRPYKTSSNRVWPDGAKYDPKNPKG